MKTIARSLALVGSLQGAAFLLCAAIAHLARDPASVRAGFLAMGLATLALSAAAGAASRGSAELRRRDAIVLVFFSWLFCGAIGALPYLVLGICPDVASALFESVSGFTTTGASVLSDLESLPRSILFWRSLTHFLGGIGILVMFIAVLPFVGAGGVQLWKAESASLFGEKLAARIAGTARIIVGVYLLLNALCALSFRIAGLSWFDAICHAFGTVATGGFSTRTDSIAAFHNPGVEWVAIAFMFISGISIVAHYRALKGNPIYYLASTEIRLYAALAAGTILLSVPLLLPRFGGDLPEAIRSVSFQTISLFSTTGFITADYDLWPPLVKILFLVLMAIGACSGSTSGAIKCSRIAVSGKLLLRQCRKILQPALVQSVKFDDVPVDNPRAIKALAYVFAYLGIIALFSMLIRPYVSDALTALSSVVACIGGVGPGMSGGGPTETFAHFPALAKMMLVACMLLGRLEIYSCLVVFLPRFWKQ